MVGRILWDIFQIIFVVSLSPLIISVVCNGDSHNGAILRVKNHATENDTLVLTCFYEHKDNVTSEWIFPKGSTAKNEKRTEETGKIISYNPGRGVYVEFNSLLIKNLTKTKDLGHYECAVTFPNKTFKFEYNLDKIYGVDDIFIDLKPEKDGIREVNSNVEKESWTVEFSAYPPVTLVWVDKEGKVIPWSMVGNKDQHLHATLETASTTLTIRKPKINDSGNYKLHAFNGRIWKEFTSELRVKEKPKLSIMEANIAVKVGGKFNLSVKVYGYPSSAVTWTFSPCSLEEFQKNTCGETKLKNMPIEANTSQLTTFNQYSSINYSPQNFGIVTVVAVNSVDRSEKQVKVALRDWDEDFHIRNDAEDILSLDRPATITCDVAKYMYTSDLEWFKDGNAIENSSETNVIATEGNYSYNKSIHWPNVNDNTAGNYTCQTRRLADNKTESKIIPIKVVQPVKTFIRCTNIDKDLQIYSPGDPIHLRCDFSGNPAPKSGWYKNGEEIYNSSNIELDDKTLTIKNFTEQDEGTYKCFAENRGGRAFKETTLKLQKSDSFFTSTVIIIICAVCLLFVIFVILLCLRIRHERNVVRELKAAGLANFESGDPESINKELGLDDQVELLPYNRKYEFPRNKLKLGKQLGSGAFGVVVKAYAEGILPGEEETAVAVKMVKKMAGNDVIRALATELKIMVHLGQHLNVVNLLGAITKDIAKRELMIIVEFCRFGNVQDFLVKNRSFFVNQIQPHDDKIDSTILSRQKVRYVQLDKHKKHADGRVLPPQMVISTTDLISWSFQVARGMQYLSSRNVLHGDLAARNVLLCEDNVVKICDFGLARSMYKREVYKKAEDSLLPIKWLAIESICDQVFSTYSDVWAFGILMWELFSLGTMPYPGMDADRSFCMRLKEGYRMEKPDYANQDIYDVMLSCWRLCPERRPLFDSLAETIGKLLPIEIGQHYVEMNSLYLKANEQCKSSNQTDYLALMASPGYKPPSKPDYENANAVAVPHYLEMKPSLRNQPQYLEMKPSLQQQLVAELKSKKTPLDGDKPQKPSSKFNIVKYVNFPSRASKMNSSAEPSHLTISEE